MRTHLAVPLLLLVAVAAHAQPAKPLKRAPRVDPDAKAIEQTARDYIEGWYEGNPERMARAVHPELQKRIVITEAGVSRIENMGASKLVANVRAGGGTKTPAAKQKKEVTILDRYENAASVKVVASDWVDYLHVARVDGRWVIVNVLWELTPKTPPKTP
ncbi:MAG: nuclear transport factor 2 family protein [Deltaproteobacteria bacterium]|nr:nuclear transport factor 2 family protein [Kofleriaceae bacterium]